MKAGTGIALLIVTLALQGCGWHSDSTARAVVETRVKPQDVVAYSETQDFADKVSKRCKLTPLSSSDLSVRALPDTKLMELRSTADSTASALQAASAMVDILAEHFDPILQGQEASPFESYLSTNGMSAEAKELARKIQKGLLPKAIVLVEQPQVMK